MAISKTTYGELRELPETRQMMIDLFNEILQLSVKAGIQIETGFIENTVSFIDTLPYETTSSLTVIANSYGVCGRIFCKDTQKKFDAIDSR